MISYSMVAGVLLYSTHCRPAGVVVRVVGSGTRTSSGAPWLRGRWLRPATTTPTTPWVRRRRAAAATESNSQQSVGRLLF